MLLCVKSQFFATKKLISLIIGVLSLAPLFHIPVANAAIPQTINYQSRLLTPAGDPVTVATQIQISFYNHPTNGASTDAQGQAGPLVWKETYDQALGACSTITPDAKGYFFLKLGSCNSFPAYLDFSETLYVGVKIGADAEASPRVQLSSHPYALNAQRVNSLQATTTAQANSLLALDSDLNFNIATGTFLGAGLNISGTSTLQNLTFAMATGSFLNLTTALAIGGIRLESVGTNNITSGASLIGVFDEFDNSNATSVQMALRDLDLAITSVSSSRYDMTLQQVTDNGSTTTNRIQFNGATSTGYIDILSYNGASAQITLDADDGSMSGGSAYLIMNGDGNGGGEAAIRMYSNGSAFGQLDGTVDNFRVIAVGNSNLTFGTQSFGAHFFEATGRLGLGTSAPSSTFHVFDRNGIPASPLLTLQNTIGDYETFVTDADPNGLVTGNLGDIAVDVANGLLYMKQAGNGTNTGWFAFATGTQAGDLQAVTDAGNITTNPIQFAGGTSTEDFSLLGYLGVNTDATSTYALHVYGGPNFGEYLAMGNGKLKWGDDGDLTHITANKDDGMIRVSSQSYIDIGDLNNGITGARISLDGNNGFINLLNANVGIGTNNPTRALEILSDSPVQTVWRNTAGEGLMIVNDNLGDEIGLSDIRTDGYIAAVSKADPALYYYARGVLNANFETYRVGINTVAPTSMLDLVGGAYGDAVLTLNADDGTAAGRDAGIIINSDNINGSDAAFIKFNNNGTHNAKLYGSTSGSGIDVAGDNPFVIGTNSWNRLTVAGNGQILIATSTTPMTDAMMVINSRNTFNALDLYTDLDPRGMSLGSDRQGGEFGWTYDSGNRLLIATRTGNDGNDYDFVDIADHAMTINSNGANGTYLGFVGINNYDPQHPLDVVGGDSWNAIASFSNASNGFHLYSTTGTPEGAVIGNVGDIAVSPSNGSAFIKQSGSGTRNGWVSFATGTGSVGPLSLQQVTDIGNVTTRSIQFAGGTSTGQFIVTDKLGIGTASPSSMLHVLGGDAGDALLILDSVDGSGSGRDAGIVINADNFNGSDVPYIMMKTNGLQTAKVYSSPWGSGFDIQNDSYFNVITQGVERFRVNGDGHVGIATTTPRALLSVDGRTTDWRLFEASNNDDREGLGMGVDAWGGDMSLYYNSGNHMLVSTYFGNVGDNYDHVFLGDRHLTVRQASGFVGIGTEQPSNRLDVRGAISIASSTPATSDQALYNLGGVLYWDGSPLSIGGLLTMQDTANYSLATDGYVLFDTGAATYEDDGGMMNIAAKDGGYQVSIGEAGGTRLNFQSQSGPPAEVLFLDARNVGNRRGIEYAGDYSEDFSVRSLVDKGFVMDYVASTTGGDLQQVTDNGNSTTNAIQFAGGTSTGKFVVNGRFGINTNNPSYAMDVNSEDSVQAIWRNSLGEGVAITNDYLGGEIGLLDARTDRIIAAASKSNLDLFHFGGRVLNVNADNFRVGINTTTPSTLFQIQGGLVGDAILTIDSDDGAGDGRDAGIVINSDNGNGSDAAYIKFNNNGMPGGKLYSGLYESGMNIEGNKSFLFRTNNLDRLNIGGDGRIGISTTTPQAIVSIDGSVIGGYRMLEVSNQDDRRGVGFGIDAFGGDLGVYYDQGNHLMVSTYFGGAGNSYDHVFLGDRHLTVRQASGFVGIGTESPANRLHVMGGISIASSTPATPVNALYNLGGELWWNGVPITSASSLADVDGDTVVMVEKNPDDDTVRFLTVGEQRMYINNVGNVGIGVNNPLVSLLQVGPNAHEASTFSASGIPGMVNIANFRDENGENVFRAAGSVANNDLVVGFGDLDFGGIGTSIKVNYSTDSINLSNSQLRFYEQGSSGEYVGFISPASLTVSTVYTLPSQDGSGGQVLSTDGAGILSWIDASGSSANIYNTDGSIPEARTVTVEDGAELRFADQNNAGNFIYLQTDYSANGNLKIGGVNNSEGGRNHFISFMDNLNMYSDGGMDFQAPTNQIDLGGQFGHLEIGSSNLFTDYHAAGSRSGLKYNEDYSADFVDRSLVDKAYVDSSLAALSFQQVTDVGNVTTKSIQFAGGTSTRNFAVERASGVASITAHTPNDDAFIDIIGNGGASALRLSSNNGGNYSIIESSSNGSFNLTANGNIVAWADASGNFGIGNNGPDVRLTVTETGNTVAAFDRLGDDGTLISLRQDGVEEGTITVSGNTVSYNAFTGSHYAWTDDSIEKGMLVTLTGDNKHLHGNEGSEMLYGVKTADTANDSRIMGVYLALQEPSKGAGLDNPHLIMAAGNGELWVTDKGENINIGDYLISSDVAGHGQKDIGEFAISHVVARAAEAIDWSSVMESWDGAKHKKISVFFESFDKNNVQSSILGSSLQGSENNIDVEELSLGSALFSGNVTIQGLVTMGKDAVGQAEIVAGHTKVRVDFVGEYLSLPIITLTPTNRVTVPYWVEGQSVKGFEIVLDGVQSNDIIFNWHAFGNDQGRIQSSDGTNVSIQSVEEALSEPETTPEVQSPMAPPIEEIEPVEPVAEEPQSEIGGVVEPEVAPEEDVADVVSTPSEIQDSVVVEATESGE